MIAFDTPWALLLLLPWAVGSFLFYRYQRASLDWVDRNVSRRFRAGLTVHDRSSLRRHVATLGAMGALLVLALAGLRVSASSGLAEGGGRLLLVLDGSASMSATDRAGGSRDDEEEPPSRFVQAKAFAGALVEELSDYEVGLVSFSGTATIRLPFTADRLLVDDALYFAETHNIYRNTGSSLPAALDTVLRFVEDDRPGLQVVLLGDGEMPGDGEDFDDALDALVAREIPVHAVTFGSLEGQGRLIYDFRDVVAKKEDKAVLQEFTTRRVDEHFERIADATGGRFHVSQDDTAAALAAAVRETPVRVARSEEPSEELAPTLFLGFALLFLLDALLYGRAAKPTSRFRLYALGDPGRPSDLHGDIPS